jgi:hypothetical protein
MKMPGQLRLNETVTFGRNGNIKEMDPYGFDLSEQLYSWTQEETAGFSIMFGASVPPDAVLRLNVAARPFTQAGHVDRQEFFVFINGLYIGYKILVAAQKSDFFLPRNVLSSRGLRIEFVIPTASSPKSAGISQDIRKLGIALEQLSITLQK